MKRAQEQLPTVVEAIKQVCGTTFVVTLVQADPTAPGGMTRPVLTEPEVRTIVDDVADDPFAAIDINDTKASGLKPRINAKNSHSLIVKQCSGQGNIVHARHDGICPIA